MPAALLIAEHLTRAFDTRVAVRDLTLSVATGEIVTVLGPNGAGKTTTMRMVAGLLLPSSGHIILNHVPLTAATAGQARRSIGLLTEAPGLWERLSVRMNLLTYARLQGLANAEQHVATALEQVGLSDRATDLAGRLSKGLKQRVAIARALIHRPPVLLLDEPTSGLDPASARHVRDLILDLRREGRAVLVSTHNLAEAEELSDRIAILNSSLLAVDTPAALRQRLSGTRVVIEVEGEASAWMALAGTMNGVTAAASGARLSLELADLGAVPDVVAALVAAGARVVRVVPERRSLEEVYLNLVGASR